MSKKDLPLKRTCSRYLAFVNLNVFCCFRNKYSSHKSFLMHSKVMKYYSPYADNITYPTAAQPTQESHTQRPFL